MTLNIITILPIAFCLVGISHTVLAVENGDHRAAVHAIQFAEDSLTASNTASDWSVKSLASRLETKFSMYCSNSAEDVVCTRAKPEAIRARIYSPAGEKVDPPLVVSFMPETPFSVDEVKKAMSIELWESEPSSRCALKLRSNNLNGVRRAVVQIQRGWEGNVCLDVARELVISFVDKTKVYPGVK